MNAPTAIPKAPAPRGRVASSAQTPQATGDDDEARAATVALEGVAVSGIDSAALIRPSGAARRSFAFHENEPTNDLLHPYRS